MDGVIMTGKVLKVIEYNLSFKETRMVNVYSIFRYKKNNNLYMIYSDPNPIYSFVFYGASHIKNDSILCMKSPDETIEIIKEYIFKLINQESLEDFEIISLDQINGIEIIASDRLEIKPEVLEKLITLTIPSKESTDVPTQQKKKSKKHQISKKSILGIIILIGILSTIFYVVNKITENKEFKTFSCTKTYHSKEINATIEEKNTYYFSINQEQLKKYIEKHNYSFDSVSDYQDFINKGTIYKYLPSDEKGSEYKTNNEDNEITITIQKEIDSSYNLPTAYEEALSNIKAKGYSCQESINNEKE